MEWLVLVRLHVKEFSAYRPQQKLNETGWDLISLLSLFFPLTNYIVPLRVKKN